MGVFHINISSKTVFLLQVESEIDRFGEESAIFGGWFCWVSFFVYRFL